MLAGRQPKLSFFPMPETKVFPAAVLFIKKPERLNLEKKEKRVKMLEGNICLTFWMTSIFFQFTTRVGKEEELIYTKTSDPIPSQLQTSRLGWGGKKLDKFRREIPIHDEFYENSFLLFFELIFFLLLLFRLSFYSFTSFILMFILLLFNKHHKLNFPSCFSIPFSQ